MSERVLVFNKQEETPKARLMSDRLLRVEGGILNGKAVSKPQPVYPPVARSANVKGTVVVRVHVGTDGSVVGAQAMSGPVLLREASEEAALRATFTPTLISGERVSVSGLLTYNFGLE
jgi:protein TonB